MIKNLPFLISGTIISIILFQSIVIAPAINKFVNVNDASNLLRHIWPIFFILIASLSLISLMLIFKNNMSHLNMKFYTISSFLIMTFCFFITPVINNAKDINNEELWSVLHLLTVVLTFTTLVLNILNIFSWSKENFN